MITRIRQLMNDNGINASQLADRISIQRSTLSHILSGRNKPSLDVIVKILDEFPEIDADWLLRGAEIPVDKSKQPLSVQDTENREALPAQDLFSGLNTIETKHTSQDKGKSSNTVNQEPENPVNTSEIPVDTNVTQKKVGVANFEERNREIENVMIFYTDGTFKSYKPS